MKKERSSVFSNITLGIQFAVIMVIFVYGGYRLDLYMQMTPVFVSLGAAAGMGTGLYNLLHELKRMEKMKNEQKEAGKKNRDIKWN